MIMETSVLKNVGRWLFGLPLVVFGLFHFMNAGQMSGMVPGFIPGGAFWVYLTGLALILAAISIFMGKMTKLAGQLLALMLLIFVLTIHLPGALEGSQSSVSSMLKDLAMAGGALLAAAFLDNEADTGENEA